MTSQTSTYAAWRRLSGRCRAAIAGYRRLIWTEPVLEKATTSLRARAQLEVPDFTQITDGVELVVPVSVTDRGGAEVVHADITTWVTPVG
jgi:Domain of unknown function (DUF4442)